jgi:FkbM family methyltransferase
MSSLDKIKNDFLSGDLTKPEYINKMYKMCHSKLFDYAEFISQTDIDEIKILDNQVYMKSRRFQIGMFCPNGDYRVAPIESLNFLGYEVKDTNMILSLIPKNGVIFDIGANMGWYSLIIAKQNKNLKVYSFEPIPKTFSFLQKNVNFNKLENIYLHNFGFSDETKDLVFYTYPEGSGNASSVNLTKRNDVESITCSVKRLDDFASSNKLKVDFIKCDVEGAELLAFLGARETIAFYRPVIFTEMLRKWSAKFDYHPNEIIDLFASMGYRCFYAMGNSLKPILKMTNETEETNFFFLHSEKHFNLINKFSN